MAIFSFPINPTLNQTYTAPNGVIYVWDGEKWLGSSASGGSAPSSDFIEKTPAAGNSQSIITAQPGDIALTLRGTTGQAGNLLELVNAQGSTLSAFDELGRLGIGTATPMYPVDVKGNIALTGTIVANNSPGLAGQYLASSGTKAYWRSGPNLDEVLAAGSTSARNMSVGDMNVTGNLVVTGTQTVINTEIIKLADNIITLNSNYSGVTPNENAGIEVNRGSLQPKSFYWDETLDKWTIGSDTFKAGLFEGNLIGNVTGQVSSLGNHTTDGLREGTTNLYFTPARARNTITAVGDVVYDKATGVISYYESVHSVNGKTGHVVLTTDDIPEGNINKYGFSANTANIWFAGKKLGDISDVDTTGVSNGSILAYDAATSTWRTITPDLDDTFTISAAFSASNGNIVYARNDGGSYVVNIDGRYLSMVDGGNVNGNTIFSDRLQVIRTPTVATDVANKDYVDTLIANTEISINAFSLNANTGILNITETNSNSHNVSLYPTLDARYVNATGDVITGNLVIDGVLSANNTTLKLNDLADVATTPVTGQVLTWNGAAWTSANVAATLNDLTDVDTTGATTDSILYFDVGTSSWKVKTGDFFDSFISGASFNPVTGEITINRNDGNNFIVDIDGRYATTVNGIAPDASGNIAISLTETQTGTLGNRPISANGGVVYVVSGDTAQNNGKTYIYVTGSGWQEVSTFDLVANDLRYVNVSGDTMTGPLMLSADPTSLLEATTKQYVDALVANSEIYTTTAVFNTSTGIITQTRNNGSTYTVDLDGRYLELTAGGNVTGNALFTGKLQTSTAPTLATDVTNKLYVDSLIANSEVYTSSAAIDPATGVLTQTRTDGTTYTTDLFAGLDGRYVNVTGDTMTGALVLSNGGQTTIAPVAGNDLVNKTYVDALVANSEVYTSNASFNATTGVLTQTRTDGSTYDVDLDGRYAITVNGASPDANGNITIGLTAVQTGTFLGRPTTSTAGVVYVVSGDANNQLNGKTYIYEDVSAQWYEVKTYDEVAADARYVNITGDTLTGPLYLDADPVSGKEAATKQYVDALVANSEVTISNFAFSIADGNLVITETNGNTHAVDLDGRFLLIPAGATSGQVVTYDGANWIAANVATNLTDLLDVDTAGVANGNILYYDAATTSWKTIAGDFADNFISSGTLQANGQLDFTRNDGNTVSVDLNGVWLSLANGGNVAGNVTFNGLVQSPTAPTTANDLTNKAYVDALVANSEVTINSLSLTGANLIIGETNGNTHSVDLFAGLDGRYVNVAGDTMTGDLVVNGNTTINGTLIANNTTLTLGKLADVADAAATTTGQVLTWDGAQWIPQSLPAPTVDTYVNSGSLNTTTGDITLTRNDGNTVTFNMDGRYLELVDGGTVTGNTIFNGNLQTPTVPSSNNDVTNKAYVDALVANSEVTISNFAFSIADGNLVITETNGNTHAVDLDGRFLLIPAGASNGQVLSFDGTNWVAGNVATTLNDLTDVDTTAAANGSILYYDAATTSWKTIAGDFADNFISSGTLQANGQLDLVRNDGNTVSVDLNGVWLSLVNGGTVTGPTIFNSTLQTPTAPVNNNDVTNKLYVDSLIASSEVYTNTASFDINTGVLTQTRNNGSTYTVDLDGRYLETPAGASNGQVLTFDGTSWVAGNVATNLADLGDVDTTGAANGSILYYNAATSKWEVIAGDLADNFITTAAFNTGDGIVTLTRNDGNTVTFDLDGRYLELTNGGTVTGNTIFNGSIQTPTAPTSGNDIVNKTYVDALVANSEVTISNFAFSIADGNLVITETNGNTHAVDLDGRFIVTPAGATTSQVLTFDGANWIAANVAATLNDLTDVDTTGAANGSILYYDAATTSWKVITGDFTDNFITSSTLQANGQLDLVRNDGNTVSVDLNGVWLSLTNGGTVTGPTIFNGSIQSPTAPTTANDLTNKAYVDALVANSEVYTNTAVLDSTTGILTQTRTDGSTYTTDLFAGLDGRYVNVTGDTVTGNLTVNGNLQTPTVPTVADDVTNKAYVDALVANSEVYTSSASFDATTGVITQTRTNGSTYVVDIDGRYAQSVNGIVPDSNGNIAVSLTAVETGPDGSKPLTANNGVVYVVSGDANTALNGKTYIFEAVSGQWYEVKGFDEAAADARYVNISGDTMVGDLTLVGDPTANLHAATKQYVDMLVANSEVYTNTATLDSTTGILTQTRTDGSTYTVDLFAGLDARYVNVTGDTITGDLVVNGNTTVDGTLIANNTTLTLGRLADVADAAATTGQVLTWDGVQWVGANTATDKFVSGVAFDNTTGIVTTTLNDGNTYTVDLDGRYLELTNGGTVTGNTIFNGNLQTPTVPTSNNDVVNKLYVDALIANSEVYTNNAVLDSTTGILTQTRTDGSTYTVDLFAGLDARYVNVTGDTITGDLTVNGNTTIDGTLIANNTTLTLGKLADVADGAATTGQVLTWDGVQWVGATSSADKFVANVTFDSTTGVVTTTLNDGNTYATDLDGRYLELTAGGTVAGPTIFNGLIQSPTAPTTANDLTNKAYVDALVANSEVYTNTAVLDSTTGILTQTRTDGTTYTTDLFAGLDARYVNVAGDTITGDLVVSGNTTVDGTLIANNTTLTLEKLANVNDAAATTNGQVLTWNGTEWVAQALPAGTVDTYTANGTVDANGLITFTRSDSNTFTVDLNGLWLSLVNGGTVTGNTIFNGNLQTPTVPTSNNDVTNKAYVDALVANSEVYTNTATLDSTTGILTQTRTDGSTYTTDLFTGLDGRYVNVAGDTITGDLVVNGNTTIDGTLIANNTTLTLGKLADVADGAATTGQVLTWDGAQWIGATSATDKFVANVVFDSITGNVTTTLNDGNTVVTNLDGRYLELVDGGTVTGNTIFNGNLQTPTVPTIADDVTNKAYVDALVANSEVYTNTASFDITNGVLTQTRTNGSTYTVDLDGRYLELPASANVGEVLKWDGAAWTPSTDLNNYVNTASFDIANGELTLTRADGTTVVTDLDGRFLVPPTATVNGQVITWNNVTNVWEAQTPSSGVTQLSLLTDVDTTGVANGDILYYNAALGKWDVIAGDLVDNFVTSGSFDQANGDITLTRNDGNTIVYNMDGRYLELVDGGTVTGNTIFNGNLQTPTVPTSNNDVTNKLYVDSLIANSEVYTNTATLDSTTGVLTQTRTNGTTYTVDLFAGLDGRYVNVAGDTMTGDLVVGANVEVQGTLIANNTTLTLGKLADVADAAATTGQVLTWDGAQWVGASASVDSYTANATFNIADGVITFTRNDGNTYTVDIDGRFAKTVNGVVPDANGNIAISLTETMTGTFGNMPMTANAGVVYVVSGDTASNNGETYIYVTGSGWQQVVSFDEAAMDARYVNVAGDTMTGPLTLPADPTNALEAATKQYVDLLVANSEVYTNTASFDITNGVLTQTRTNGTTYTVDLDGRYLETPVATTNGQVITWNNVTGLWEAQTPATGVTQLALLTDVDTTGVANGDILYYNASLGKWDVIAGDFIDNFVTSGSFDAANGDVTLVRNDGNNIIYNMDGRYLELIDGGTVTGNTIFNGNLQTPTAPTSNNDVTNKAYVDALVANSEVYTNNAVLDSTTGILTQTRTNGTTYTVDLFAGLDARYVNVAGDTMTGDLVVTANVEVQGTLIANNTTLTLGKLADVADATPTVNGQVLTWDGTQWVGTTLSAAGFDNYVANGAFVANNTVSTINLVYANTALANAVIDVTHSITNHSDVDTLTVAPTNNQVLTWDATTSLWVPKTVSHVTIADVPPTGQIEGDLWYDSNTTFRTYVWSTTAASWLDVAPQPAAGSTIQYIDELLDVDTTTKAPIAGSSVLGWNGTNWVPVEVLDANGGTANDF